MASAHIPTAQQKIIERETPVLGCSGYNMVQNNGESAGQTVFHYHMHLIPRYDGDNSGVASNWNHAELSEEEMKEVCEIMKI